MLSSRNFSDAGAIRAMARRSAELARRAGRPLRFMEVCGTHTMAVARSGLRSLFPEGVELISGPGCPVCVTPDEALATACRIAREPGCTVATFGDMLRVPGPEGSLEEARAGGGDVRMVYSSLDAVEIARLEPERRVVFIGIGFETTAPTVAGGVLAAERDGVGNFFVLPVGRLIPPAMQALLSAGEVAIDGFLCPGHVSTIIGPEAYEPFAAAGAPCVITGFEPSDVMQGVMMLIEQAADGRSEVQIQYGRAVRPGGNPRAREVIARVFDVAGGSWRGLGVIPQSALVPNAKYARFDAASALGVEQAEPAPPPSGCRCGEVLRGILRPWECPLFGARCTVDHPVGACMVSSEGSCAAAYRYRDMPGGGDE